MSASNSPPYDQTLLEFLSDPPVTVDLRAHVDGSILESLRSVVIEPPFAVVTAFNPAGKVMSDADNLARTTALEAELTAANVPFVRVDGYSPDRTHREQGVAIHASLDAARKLAARFGQDAIFWFDGDAFWLVGVADAAARMRLPAKAGQRAQTAERARRFGRNAGQEGKRFAAWTVEGIRQGASGVRNVSSSVVDQVLKAPGALATHFVKERSIPAVLLPTGSGPADYWCVFRFDDVVAELERGILIRPRLEVWAGREDIDRGRLARTLRDEFTSQLREKRESARSRLESRHKRRLKELERQAGTSGRKVQGAVAAVSAWLLFMFFAANPIFDLLFLCLAVFSGADGITRVLKYVRDSGRLRTTKQDIEKQQRRIEQELGESAEAFTEAVRGLQIRVHPALESLVADFVAADGKEHIPSVTKVDSAQVPDVVEFLSSAEYRRRVPEWLHPIVDSHAST